jgi:transcriptional regulator with XRE-family HTH domain
MIRQLRLSKGLTIQELADKSGIERSFLSRLERGQREWTVETLAQVCAGLEEKLLVLFG